MMEEFLSGPLIGDREVRRHAGLDRKPLQNPFAERVDRLDAQASGRIDDPREQRARVSKFACFGCTAETVEKLVRERLLVQRRPLRKEPGQPVAHLGGGGLREGQTQDRRRPRARQQQAHDARGQHVRLSRTGIGDDPDRIVRICGGALVGEPGFDVARSHSSSPPVRPFAPAREVVVVTGPVDELRARAREIGLCRIGIGRDESAQVADLPVRKCVGIGCILRRHDDLDGARVARSPETEIDEFPDRGCRKAVEAACLRDRRRQRELRGKAGDDLPDRRRLSGLVIDGCRAGRAHRGRSGRRALSA